MVGSPVRVWILKDEFVSKILKMRMPVDYINMLKTLISTPTLIVLIVIPSVFGSLPC